MSSGGFSGDTGCSNSSRLDPCTAPAKRGAPVVSTVVYAWAVFEAPSGPDGWTIFAIEGVLDMLAVPFARNALAIPSVPAPLMDADAKDTPGASTVAAALRALVAPSV